MRLVKRAVQVAALTGGLVLAGAGAAHADTTSGDNGVLSGNQVNPNVNAPVTACGNAVGVVGSPEASCAPNVSGGGAGHNRTSGDNGVLSGNQVNPNVNAPVTVCGNAVGVVGDPEAACPDP